MWCRTGFTNLIRVKVKVKEKKKTKVGKKRKKDKKHTKLDCQDSSSRFSASCWLRVPETSPRSKENKIQDTFDIWILCQEQLRNPPSGKETLLTRFQTQMRCKKVTLIVQISFAEKNYSRRECDLPSMADFRDVVSVLPAARLIRQVESLLLKKKLIDREKSRSLSWLSDCHRSRARKIKEAAACELIGTKKGRNFQFNLFLCHSANITFRVIMSFRKLCHMSFCKLIPPFTLTAITPSQPVDIQDNRLIFDMCGLK